jgi:uncharacterized protein YcbX
MHELNRERPVGRVVGLWRYPVKSMAGEALSEVEVSWHGFAGDRRWAFIREGVMRSGFPWFTLRERSDLSHYHPSFLDPTQPDRSTTVVSTPSGARYDVTDASLAKELSPNGDVRVIKQDRGIFDTFPLSLVTVQTIDRLEELSGFELEVARFRPNILVETFDGTPFAEDMWIGRELRIGGLRMRVDERDSRCAVITIDPRTAQRAPDILRTVAREREGCVGVYGTTVQPGRIAVNDLVYVPPG